MKLWKRVLPFLLIAAMLLSLCGCGDIQQTIADTVSDAVGQALNDVLSNIELEDMPDGGISDELSDGSENSGEPTPSAEAELSEAEASAPPAEEAAESAPSSAPTEAPESSISEDGWYTTKEDVAEYLKCYRRLPGNFMTKNEARDAYDWDGGGLPDRRSIGGDRFGNREGLLPSGYTYTECDIDTMGAKSRGAKRIVFTITKDEMHIYYTDDHYESFTLLYEEVT